MPWTASDSTRFNKKNTKTDKKRRQFSHVANSILKRTGDEGRAIRGANAAVGRKKKRKSSRS